MSSDPVQIAHDLTVKAINAAAVVQSTVVLAKSMEVKQRGKATVIPDNLAQDIAERANILYRIAPKAGGAVEAAKALLCAATTGDRMQHRFAIKLAAGVLADLIPAIDAVALGQHKLNVFTPDSVQNGWVKLRQLWTDTNRIDPISIGERLEIEAARAGETYKAGRAIEEPEGTLLDRINDLFKGQALNIIRYLYGQKHSVSFQSLGEKCWGDEPTDEAIHQGLKRAKAKLNLNTALGLDIEITNEANNKRAKLERLRDK